MMRKLTWDVTIAAWFSGVLDGLVRGGGLTLPPRLRTRSFQCCLCDDLCCDRVALWVCARDDT